MRNGKVVENTRPHILHERKFRELNVQYILSFSKTFFLKREKTGPEMAITIHKDINHTNETTFTYSYFGNTHYTDY